MQSQTSPKHFKLVLVHMLSLCLSTQAIGQQFTEQRFIETHSLPISQISQNIDPKPGYNIYELPFANYERTYCITLHTNTFISDPKGWEFDFLSQNELLGQTGNTFKNQLPYQVPSTQINASGNYITFSFTPRRSDGDEYLFTFKATKSGDTTYFHPELFHIRILNEVTFGIEQVLVNGATLKNPTFELAPDQILKLSIQTVSEFGNVEWEITTAYANDRQYEVKNSISQDKDALTYHWDIQFDPLDPLTPSQLGGLDTLYVTPLDCANNPIGPQTVIYINVPMTRIICANEAIERSKQLPPGSPGTDYRGNIVSFKLVPEGVDYTGYNDWTFLDKDKPLENGSSFAQLTSNGQASRVVQLVGIPDFGEEYTQVLVKVENKTHPGEPSLQSDTFTLSICSGSFRDVPTAYEVIDLSQIGVIPISTNSQKAEVTAISNSGYILGKTEDSKGVKSVVVWHKDQTGAFISTEIVKSSDTLSPNWFGKFFYEANDINDAGLTVGKIYLSYPDTSNFSRGYLWELDFSHRKNYWSGHSFPKPGYSILAHEFTSINNDDGIAGVLTVKRSPNAAYKTKFESSVTYLDQPQERFIQTFGKIEAINDLGDAIGVFYDDDVLRPDDKAYVILKNFNSEKNDGYSILPSFSNNFPPFNNTNLLNARVNEINNVRRICGMAQRWMGAIIRNEAALWGRNETNLISLHLPGFTASEAFGINDLSQVVGTQLKNGIDSAFIYDHRLHTLKAHLPPPQNAEYKYNDNTEAKNNWIWLLDDLIPRNSPFHITSAKGINNAGWIIGQAIDKKSGQKKPVLLIPKQPLFRIFKDTTIVAINNRDQIVFEKGKDQNKSFYIWEECIGQVLPEQKTPILDINDDMMVLMGNRVVKQLKGTGDQETWVDHVLPIASTNSSFPPPTAQLLSYTASGINNANVIVGTYAFTGDRQKKGLVWYPENAPSNSNQRFALPQITPYSLMDVNSSGLGIARKGPLLMTGTMVDTAGVYSIRKNKFSSLSSSFRTGYLLSPGSQPIEVVRGISDAGVAVGVLNFPLDNKGNVQRGYIAAAPYTFNTHVREFYDRFIPLGINNLGWVVGTQDGSAKAFVMDHPTSLNGRMVDLNTLLSAEDQKSWHLESAQGINDRGRVYGIARKKGEKGELLERKGFVFGVY